MMFLGFIPLEWRPGSPYIESGGQVTCGERGSPDRVVVSLREGDISLLGLQASLSYPGIMARSGLVIIVILFACRGLAWRDATVPAVVALLAWR
jgi:hypothetical protein